MLYTLVAVLLYIVNLNSMQELVKASSIKSMSYGPYLITRPGHEKYPAQSLHQAINENNLRKATRIVEYKIKIRKKFLIDEVDRYDQSALDKACDNNNLEMVKMLLKNGANVNMVHAGGYTTFSRYFLRVNAQIFACLLPLVKDINAKNGQNRESVLERAYRCNRPDKNYIIRQLIAAGAVDVNSTYVENPNPPGWVGPCIPPREDTYLNRFDDFLSRQLRKLYLLSQAKAPESSVPVSHEPAKPGTSKDASAAEILKVSPTEQKEFLATASTEQKESLETASTEQMETASSVAPSNYYTTPLHRALREKNTSEIQRIISEDILRDKKYGINIIDEGGNTPLMIACGKNGNDLSIIKLLVESGADVHYQDEITGFTPLYRACRHNYTDLVKYLIPLIGHFSVSVCTNVTDPKALTPLHYILSYENDELILLFLKAGGNSSLLTQLTKSQALYYLCHKREEDIALARNLVENGADVNYCSSFGMNAFVGACSHGHEKIALFLFPLTNILYTRPEHSPVKQAYIRKWNVLLRALIKKGITNGLSAEAKEEILKEELASKEPDQDIINALKPERLT